VLLEALVELKNPMALSGIEPDALGLQHSASTNYFTVCPPHALGLFHEVWPFASETSQNA
jgi:hypothetical protein